MPSDAEEQLERYRRFVAEIYWDDCGLNIWDQDEYSDIIADAKLRNSRWVDQLSYSEMEAADLALRSLGQLPKYNSPTNEDYERLCGIIA